MLHVLVNDTVSEQPVRLHTDDVQICHSTQHYAVHVFVVAGVHARVCVCYDVMTFYTVFL